MNVDYLIAALAFGVPAFLAARICRNFRHESEALARVCSIPRVDGAVDRYAGTDASGDYAGTDSGADSHDDGRTYGPAKRRPGRRTIYRDHNGAGSRGAAAGRSAHCADAPAVTRWPSDR
jgi:hypothetical protein